MDTVQEEPASSERRLAAQAAPRGVPGFHAWIAESWAQLGIVSAAVTAMFVPVVIVPYAFSDDYTALWMADSRESTEQFGENMLTATAITGRALAGLVDDLVFTMAGTVENLCFVRVFAVLGIVALALLLHWALVRARMKPTVAALIAVFICSLPSFQVYASWTCLFNVPYAAVLAGAASLVAVAAIDGPSDLLLDRLVGATVLFVAALQVYQPGAMYFWVFLAIGLVGARDDAERAWRLTKTHLALGLVAFAVSYVIIKVSVYFLGEATTGAGRNELAHDVPDKARWFVTEPLYRALNLVQLVPSAPLAVAIAALAAAGIGFWLIDHARRPWLYAGVGLLLVPLCYLPNLVVAEDWGAYRTQVALSSLLALYTSLSVIAIWLAARAWLHTRYSARSIVVADRLAMALGIGTVAFSAFLAARNVTLYFAIPQITELRLLEQQVGALPNGLQRITFVQTGWGEGATKHVIFDEFGTPSTSRVWVVEPATLLALKKQGRLVDGYRPYIDLYVPNTVLPDNVPHIDLNQLRAFR